MHGDAKQISPSSRATVAGGGAWASRDRFAGAVQYKDVLLKRELLHDRCCSVSFALRDAGMGYRERQADMACFSM